MPAIAVDPVPPGECKNIYTAVHIFFFIRIFQFLACVFVWGYKLQSRHFVRRFNKRESHYFNRLGVVSACLPSGNITYDIRSARKVTPKCILRKKKRLPVELHQIIQPLMCTCDRDINCVNTTTRFGSLATLNGYNSILQRRSLKMAEEAEKWTV